MPSLMPIGRQQYLDSSGAPLIGGKVYTYAAGTTTPQATYADQAGLTPNTNPVVLDARGEAEIWWGGNAYKVVLKDKDDATIWTVDHYQAPILDTFPDVTGGANTVPVINSGATGWLYKTAAQFLAFLGLGTPNAASGVVVLDAASKLPAVDGSQLTGISSLPTQTGNNGKFLTTNGSAASWSSPPGRLIATQALYSGTSATLNAATTAVEVVLVGGGGGGAGATASGGVGGGGGGAGQEVRIPKFAASGTLSYTLGAGGPGGNNPGVAGTAGGNSTCNGVTAYGGGGGTAGAGAAGGNYGGAGSTNNAPSSGTMGCGGKGASSSAAGNTTGGNSPNSPGVGGAAGSAGSISATAGGYGAGGGGSRDGSAGGGGGAAGPGPYGGNGGNGGQTGSSGNGAAGGGGYIYIVEYA